MSDILEKDEQKLEHLKIKKEIAGEEADIAARKAYEKEMKRRHGPNWRHILGMVKGAVRPNREAIQDLYAINPELRELSRPGGRRYR